MPDDEQPRDIGAIHIRVNAMNLLPGLIARRNLLSARQLQNRIASADRPRREHPIHIPVGVGLRRRRKQQEILAFRHMQFRIRNGTCHTAFSQREENASAEQLARPMRAYSITLARISASGTKHSSYFPKMR